MLVFLRVFPRLFILQSLLWPLWFIPWSQLPLSSPYWNPFPCRLVYSTLPFRCFTYLLNCIELITSLYHQACFSFHVLISDNGTSKANKGTSIPQLTKLIYQVLPNLQSTVSWAHLFYIFSHFFTWVACTSFLYRCSCIFTVCPLASTLTPPVYFPFCRVVFINENMTLSALCPKTNSCLLLHFCFQIQDWNIAVAQ